MTDVPNVSHTSDLEENRQQALDAAHRMVQFLESGQATGAIVLLTDDTGVVMWDTFCTPHVVPIGECANVMGELGARFRRVWYQMHFDATDRDHLGVVADDDGPEVGP